MILGKILKYPPKVVVKKAIGKSFTLARNYLQFINDTVLRTGLRGDDLYEKILGGTERIHCSLSWQPVASKGRKDKIIKEADKSKNHIFNLLGSGDVRVD